MTRKRFLARFLAILAAALFLLTSGLPAFARRGSGSGGDDDDDGGNSGGGGNKALLLRVNDAIAAPGGTAVVVLRTYAPRPVRQGQMVVRVVRRPKPQKALGLTLEEITQPVRPLTLVSAVVYSQRNDSTSQANLTGQPDSQSAMVKFASPSGTVNASDGPLAVFRFRVDPSVQPGQVFDLSIDPALTGITDASGRPVTLEPRNATLTIRNPSTPYSIEADGDKAEPGELTELSVNTYEPFLTSGGRITLVWDPQIMGGTPTVLMDPRYGKASFTVNAGKPGWLVVDFKSPDSSYNSTPGSIVSIAMRISPSASIGATSPFRFDPAGTYLLNRRGKKIPIRMESGEIEVR